VLTRRGCAACCAAGLEALATKGDNDPLDVVDLSTLPMETGSVVEMKLLGVLAMIDEGEVDWKVVAINVCDPKAALVNCLADAETHFPGQVDRIREWFTWYKAVDGLPGDGPLSSNKLEGTGPRLTLVPQSIRQSMGCTEPVHTTDESAALRVPQGRSPTSLVSTARPSMRPRPSTCCARRTARGQRSWRAHATVAS
jgi:hypothetical protein